MGFGRSERSCGAGPGGRVQGPRPGPRVSKDGSGPGPRDRTLGFRRPADGRRRGRQNAFRTFRRPAGEPDFSRGHVGYGKCPGRPTDDFRRVWSKSNAGFGLGADLPKSVRSIPMDGDANHGQTVRKSENPTAPSGPDFSSSTTLNLRPEGLRTLLPGFPERKFAFGRS